MEVTSLLELKTAPQTIFDMLPERGTRIRFMIPTGDGDWRGMTWIAFAAQIRAMGSFLCSQGLNSGDRFAILAPNRVEWLSAALGGQAVGGAFVPIYPSCTPDQVAYIIDHSDSELLFVDTPILLGRVLEAWDQMTNLKRVILLDDSLNVPQVLSKLRKSGKHVPSYHTIEGKFCHWSQAISIGDAYDKEFPENFEEKLRGVSLDLTSMMIYTSGTTGPPKGVPLTHYNVGVNGRDWLNCNAPLVEIGDVDLLWLPMSHIFGFGEACLGNTLGFTSYLCDPYSVLPLLQKVKPNVLMSVPRYWEKLAMAAMAESDSEKQKAKLQEVTGGNLRFCLSGGAGLKYEIKEFFHKNGMLIIEGYGLTEASPTITFNRPDAFRFDTVGRPLPSVTVKLADDGEILAKGDNVFSGYHKNPEATKEAFNEDGWLLTGDLGRFTEDGFLQIIGRKKEILVTAGGKNIPPANIELEFMDHPFIVHLVVYGDGKPFLTAGVWINEAELSAAVGPDVSRERLNQLIQEEIDRVNAKLAKHETIKKFLVMDKPLTVENGLLTPTLKIKRKAIYEAFEEIFEGLYL